MDHAAVAPLPQSTAEEIGRWAQQSAHHGDTVWASWRNRMEEVRLLATRLVGASPPEIALVPNTTWGINLVAEGLDWRAGDNIVTLRGEFPSNSIAWLNLSSRGVEVRQLDVPPPSDGPGDELVDHLLAGCDSRTRLITVSWVDFCTGRRIDVEELVERAHRAGVLVFLDAIQGLGVLSLDVRAVPVDFLAADGHKWMLGPEGAGILYVRREHLDRLRPLGLGWNSAADPHDFSRAEFSLRNDAARYEGGSYNMLGFAGLGKSLELLLQCGVDQIAQRLLDINQYAAHELTEVGFTVNRDSRRRCQSGILSLDWPAETVSRVRGRCMQEGVVVNARGGRIRISPHAYNNRDDVGRLIAALKKARP